jgi:hypothetical protein
MTYHLPRRREDAKVRALKELATRPAADIVGEVFERIDRFAGQAPQHDDITLMLIKVTDDCVFVSSWLEETQSHRARTHPILLFLATVGKGIL